MYQPLIRPFLGRHVGPVLGTLGVGLLNSAVTLLLPLSLGRFYEQFFGGTSNRGTALDTLGLGWLGGTGWATFFGLFAGLIVLRGLFEALEYWLTGTLGEQFTRHLREQTFAHHLALRADTHRQKAVGKYLLRYSSDFGSLRRYLTKGLMGFTRDILFLTVALGLLAWLNAPLTGLLLLTTLPFLGLFRWVNNRLEAYSARRRDLRSGYVGHVTARLQTFETIKAFNRETIENEQFAKRSGTLTQANLDALRWRAGLEGLLPIALYALVFAVLLGVHTLLPNGAGRAGGGVIVTFILMVLSLRPVLRRLLRVGSVWRSGWLSGQKLTDFLNLPPEQNGIKHALTITEGHITFDAVSFAYELGKSVLTDFSLSARAGTITRMPGGPGTGKSTAFKLLLGLYVPAGGTVCIDGQNLADCSVSSVRKVVTLASADLPLLGRTVFEAVSYSRKADKRPRAESLLNELQTLAGLPTYLTLDTPIGEQGRTLSAGQQSVLRLVRALLTRKPILLLDEPFTGLSDEAAENILDWLESRKTTQTILLASCRHVVDPVGV